MPKTESHTEIELKLTGDARAFKAMRADLAAQPFLPVIENRPWRVQTYYDTRGLDLFLHDLELRVRPTAKGFRQTLKRLVSLSKEGVFTREEIQTNQKDSLPDIKTLKNFLPRLVYGRTAPALYPLIRTEFVRTRFMVGEKDTQIECALDEGQVVFLGEGEELVRPVFLLELEVKEGETAGIVSLAKSLQKRYDLTIMRLSKPEQAAQLACEAGALDGHPAFESVARKLKDRLKWRRSSAGV